MILAYNAGFDVLKNAVDNIRRVLNINLSDYPIDIYDVIEKFPYLQIYEQPFITDGLCGFLIRNKKPSASIIVINSNISSADKNFAICHEIIHYFCHPEKLTKKLLSAYNKNVTETFREKQANEGAAELLIPKEIFISEMANAREYYNDEDLAIQNTAHLYNVAPEVIHRRIENLSKGEYEYGQMCELRSGTGI